MTGATTVPAGLPVGALAATGAVTGVLAGLGIGGVTGLFLPSLDETGPRASTRVNRAVLWVLRSPAHRLMSGALLELDYRGRHSGARYALPVQYATSADIIVVWPGHPERKTWWHNVREPAAVRLLVAGRRLDAVAHTVDPRDPDYAALRAVYASRFPRLEPRATDHFVVLDPAPRAG